MEIYVLGTGGMMPLPGRHLTSVLARREGELLLFDCGEATQVSLRRLNLRWKKISTIFISHTHADHVTGLPGLLMLSSQVEREEPLTIIGPPKIAEYIQSSCRSLDMYINYEIIVKELENPGKSAVVHKGDGYQVRSVPLYHSKTCVGYVLEEEHRPGTFFPKKALDLGVPCGPSWARLQAGETVQNEAGDSVSPEQVMGPPRKGRKFSFVTDTSYSPKIAPFVADSDLLICEGMFDDSLADSAREKKHLTASLAGKIASEAGGVKQMGLIHYSPRYTRRELELLEKEARMQFPNAFLCYDRMKLDIPFED